MSNFREFWGPFMCFVAAIFAVIVGLAMIMAFAIGPVSCHARWEKSGHATDWSLFGDCRVEINGKFVPEDTVRRIDL